jgi:hypothetical protein
MVGHIALRKAEYGHLFANSGSKAVRELAGVAADVERDGNADAEDVDDDTYDHHFYGKGEFCGCGELYDDAIHEEVDGNAVKDAGQGGVSEQKWHDAACEEENCGGSEGDDEMQCEAEECG